MLCVINYKFINEVLCFFLLFFMAWIRCLCPFELQWLTLLFFSPIHLMKLLEVVGSDESLKSVVIRFSCFSISNTFLIKIRKIYCCFMTCRLTNYESWIFCFACSKLLPGFYACFQLQLMHKYIFYMNYEEFDCSVPSKYIQINYSVWTDEIMQIL